MSVNVETMIMEMAMNARDAADALVAKRSDAPAIPTYVSAWRHEGEALVSVIEVTVDANRDEMLAIATKLRTGADADAVILSFDTYYALTVENPDTGVEWAPGEMQDYVDRHGSGKVVVDSLNVTVATPDGVWTVLLPYRRTRRRIIWLTPADCDERGPFVATPMKAGPKNEDGVEMTGTVPNVLSDIMSREPLDLSAYPGKVPEGLDVRALADFYTMSMIGRAHDCVIGSRYYAEPANLKRMETAMRRAGEDFLMDQWKN
jgi:hypothetical protein